LLQDDANVPNLLGLPYLGAVDVNDPIYQNTRKFVLSSFNPYFFKGKAAEGIGSPHTLVDNIWHIGLVMRAMTSTNDQEIASQLKMIKNTRRHWFHARVFRQRRFVEIYEKMVCLGKYPFWRVDFEN
jgi:meiotically up-regulated gene 157 (Mug157) protein